MAGQVSEQKKIQKSRQLTYEHALLEYNQERLQEEKMLKQ